LPRFRLEQSPAPARHEAVDTDLSSARALAKSAWDKGEALAAAGDAQAAVAWLGRAHRIATGDQNILFSLAWQHLRAGDATGAASLFSALVERHGTRETYCGWIAALLALGRFGDAEPALRRALATTAADPGLGALADQLQTATDHIGWCGLREDGRLLVSPPHTRLHVLLDGAPVKLRRISPGVFGAAADLTAGQRLDVRSGDVPLLGSPLCPDTIFRLEGAVAHDGNRVMGWAWHPGAPGLGPRLTITGIDRAPISCISAQGFADSVTITTPLARPRAFTVPSSGQAPLRVLGRDGRDLLGSPAVPPDTPAPSPRKRRRLTLDTPVDVVIPVYRGLATTLACLASVIETVPARTRIWVVDDASPEPDLIAALRRLAADGSIRLIASDADGRNRGFPAAANAGMRAAAGRHVMLLNSDTLVAPGWLETLRDAACSAADIGTATPFSNDASILSYPGEAGKNPVPDRAATRRLATLASRANRGRLVEIPTAHGFCMFIRRDCLDQTGLFDERLFAQGYGEENDFSERAAALGWRHVAVPGVFVAHVGGASFGAARTYLLDRNLRLLEKRHPGYMSRVDAWIAADPLAPARRRLDIARWRASGRLTPLSVLLVSHNKGGGTGRIVAERAAFHRAAGYRPIILRPSEGACEISDGESLTPNLRFSLPREAAILRRFLAEANPVGGEVHHLLGHHHSVMDIFTTLGVPYDIWVHDYAWFCARLSFITGEGRFCGEPEASVCDICVSRWGYEIEEVITPADLRRRAAADLRGARAVIVPSEDVARRVARHVPGLAAVIQPWEIPPPPLQRRALPRRPRRRVAVIGAIGVEKGYDVLLGCARDAAARQLPVEFVVVGYTVDDEKLLETGCVFITGAFAATEATALIRAQSADLAFLPSIWPETWCYALSDAWAAGLPAAVFDIGTPPARIRTAGHGWVLPLGLPAPRVNDALLHVAGLATTKALLPAL
jgi:GT2 family glycosyltransferase/glycosyltransferase involved in cell wall biosynthesis